MEPLTKKLGPYQQFLSQFEACFSAISSKEIFDLKFQSEEF